MENIKQITAKTQTKLNHYLSGLNRYIHLPDYKFISDIIYGILKSKHLHLAKIARTLNERITPKKTEERLRYHLKKKGLYKSIQQLHLENNRHQIKKLRYMIFDGSDIIKKQAEKMEGLALVRDGSKSSSSCKTVLGRGYHWDNVIGVSEDGERLIPLYSEIYSNHLDEDYSVSENRKIINTIKQIREYISSEQILVIDRGGDRRVLISEFLNFNQFFIIRQKGDRYLFYRGRALPLKKIYRKAKLQTTYKVVRNHHNRTEEHVYKVGAIRVYFPTPCLQYPIEDPLWLVVVKEKKHGYSWFLCRLPADDEQEAIELAMKGYQYRWKIEEFHRQIKQDYNLEDICYQNYNCIKTIGSLLLLVMGFISSIDKLFTIIILSCTRLLERNRLKDIPNYYFYRLTEAIRIIFSRTVRYYRPKKPKICEQISLNLL